MDLNEALKMLANPTRRAILTWLDNPDEAFKEHTQLYPYKVHGVCASLIQDKIGLSQPATSLCLKALQDAGFLEAKKVGKWTYYKSNSKVVEEVIAELRSELGNSNGGSSSNSL